METPTNTYMVPCKAPAIAAATSLAADTDKESESEATTVADVSIAGRQGYGRGVVINPPKPKAAPRARVGGATATYVLTATVTAGEQVANKTTQLKVSYDAICWLQITYY
jgi:hypothetical protein